MPTRSPGEDSSGVGRWRHAMYRAAARSLSPPASCWFLSERSMACFSIHYSIAGFTEMHSFTPLARAERDDSLPFSGASSIPLCYVLFPATLLHQLFFHPLSPHLAIYFLVYLSISLFPNSYTIPFWEFYFLPFSVHVQTNVIYLTLLYALGKILVYWWWKYIFQLFSAHLDDATFILIMQLDVATVL